MMPSKRQREESTVPPLYEAYDFSSGNNIDPYGGLLPMRQPSRIVQSQTEAEWKEKSRERNRQHARNTRERKKMLIDNYEKRISSLMQERAQLNDALASRSGPEGAEPSAASTVPQIVIDEASLKTNFLAIQEQEAELVDNMEDINSLKGDSTNRSELINLRKERNRIHAKKTRLRKKKLMKELEVMASTLEAEVSGLRERLYPLLAKQQSSTEPPPGEAVSQKGAEEVAAPSKTIPQSAQPPRRPEVQKPQVLRPDILSHPPVNRYQVSPEQGEMPPGPPLLLPTNMAPPDDHFYAPNGMNPFMLNPLTRMSMMNPMGGGNAGHIFPGYPSPAQQHLYQQQHPMPAHGQPRPMYSMPPPPSGPSGPQFCNPYRPIFPPYAGHNFGPYNPGGYH